MLIAGDDIETKEYLESQLKEIEEKYFMTDTETVLYVGMLILVLTLAIYFSSIIEFKGMKKYWIDNLKVFLVMFLLIVL